MAYAYIGAQGGDMSLAIAIDKRENGGFTVGLCGEIDSSTYSMLEEKLQSILTMVPKTVLFNMREVTYVSSMGVGVILKTKLAVENNKGIFIMTNLQPQVRNVFKIIESLPNLNIFAGMDEAEDYLRKTQQ
jgi:anti-anti-sigma factor